MIDEIRQNTGLPRRAPPIVGRSAERVLLREQLEAVSANGGQHLRSIYAKRGLRSRAAATRVP